MRPRIPLLIWLFRQSLGVTLAALAVALCYLLLARQVLTFHAALPAFFIAAHSLAIARCHGRPYSGARAFLYTRGFSRDALWLHTMLAGLLAVLAVVLPASLAIWLGLRSYVQEWMFHNPFFPIMAPLETPLPLWWLALYLLFVSIFHYAYIRQAQPARGTLGPAFLAAGLIAAVMVPFVMWRFVEREPWYRTLGLWALAISVVAMLSASFILHRRMEVMS